MIETKFGSVVADMMREMLSERGPSPQDIAKLMHSKMDISDAVQRLNGQLPDEVASLVRLTGASAQSPQSFDEASLQKARRILNNMMITAWGELDDIIFECKEFQERNRGTYEQVVGDLARLGAQLANLGDKRVEASEAIMEQDRLRKEAEATIYKRTMEFIQKRLANDKEMNIRKNDLAVFDMILMMTKCQSSTQALLQVDTSTSFSAVSDAAAEDSNTTAEDSSTTA